VPHAGGGLVRSRSRPTLARARSRANLPTTQSSSSFTSGSLTGGTSGGSGGSNGLSGIAVLGGDLHVPEERTGAWRTLLYSLCGLHAVVTGRQRFRALGWGADVAFSPSDLHTSALLLRNLLCAHPAGVLPLAQFRRLVLLAGYGGRVTNPADYSLLGELVGCFFNGDRLDEGFDMSGMGVPAYLIPTLRLSTTEVLEAIEEMPTADAPEVIRLHANAATWCNRDDSRRHVALLQRVLPTVAGVSLTVANTDSVRALCGDIAERLPRRLLNADASVVFRDVEVHATRQPLIAFMLQETSRVDGLLSLVFTSLLSLLSATGGGKSTCH